MSTDLAEIETTERRTAVDADGFVYDVDTGEIVDFAPISESLWQVDSVDAADWALEIRSKIEGELAGVNTRIQAVNEQLERRRNGYLRRLAYWEFRFGPSLVAFARSLLTGKSKTAQFNWGRVQFRSTPGSNQIVDNEAAIAFVRTWAPELVVVKESVGIKAVLAAAKIAEEATGENDPPAFLVSSPAGENVTITTGIEIKGKA